MNGFYSCSVGMIPSRCVINRSYPADKRCCAGSICTAQIQTRRTRAGAHADRQIIRPFLPSSTRYRSYRPGHQPALNYLGHEVGKTIQSVPCCEKHGHRSAFFQVHFNYRNWRHRLYSISPNDRRQMAQQQDCCRLGPVAG